MDNQTKGKTMNKIKSYLKKLLTLSIGALKYKFSRVNIKRNTAVMANQSYYEHFKTLSAIDQDIIIGREKAELFRNLDN
jgi:hypothetical protein